jgi:outer membrane protein TolC
MKKFCTLIFILGLTGTANLRAQQFIDLKTALRYAEEHHAEIKKANIEIEKGRQVIRESLSSGLPQVTLNGTIINNPSIRTSFVPAEFFGGSPGDFARVQFGTNWNASSGLQFEQLVFNKTWFLGLEASRKLTQLNELLLQNATEAVLYEVAKLYYQIKLSQTQGEILNANLAQIEGLVSLVQKQYEEGFAKQIDLDRLKVQRSNLLNQKANLDLQLQQAEQALKFAMQMPLDTDIELTDSISAAPLPQVFTALTQPEWQARPQLLLLKKEQELLLLDERRWKSAYFPTLSFFASYNYEWQANNLRDFGNSLNWTDFSQVGLRINMTIFDGMFRDSRVQRSRLDRMQNEQNLRMATMGVQLRHEAAITSLQANQNTLKSVLENKQLAENIYQIAQKRFSEGLAPMTELLDSESSMRQAQTNYLTTLAQIKLSEIDLLHMNGQIKNLMN